MQPQGFATKCVDFPNAFEGFCDCSPNAMYRFSTVANVLAKRSIFLLLACMERIDPDNAKELAVSTSRDTVLRG